MYCPVRTKRPHANQGPFPSRDQLARLSGQAAWGVLRVEETRISFQCLAQTFIGNQFQYHESLKEKLSTPSVNSHFQTGRKSLDESGSIVGWVLLDTDGTKISDNKITCAAVSLGGQVKGFDYRSEENVDILVLQAGKEGPGSYLRIGRGRVVRKGWLRTCSEENVLVF